MLEFTIKSLPVGKGRPIFSSATKHCRTPLKTKAFESLVAAAAIEEMKGKKPSTAPILMNVEIYINPPKSWSEQKKIDAFRGAIAPTCKPDLDNVAKAIADALNGIAYHDDKQIISMHIDRGFTKEAPHILVLVEESYRAASHPTEAA